MDINTLIYSELAKMSGALTTIAVAAVILTAAVVGYIVYQILQDRKYDLWRKAAETEADLSEKN